MAKPKREDALLDRLEDVVGRLEQLADQLSDMTGPIEDEDEGVSDEEANEDALSDEFST